MAEWEERALSDIAELVSRGTAPRYVNSSSVGAIGQRCVQGGRFDPNAARPHSEKFVDGVLWAREGDVLLNSTGTGTIGRSCVYPGGGRHMVDSHVTVIRARPGAGDGRFIAAVLQSPAGQSFLERRCYSGSTNQVELSASGVRQWKYLWPGVLEQRRIADVLDALDAAISATERLVSKLSRTRQGVLEGELQKLSRLPDTTVADLAEHVVVGIVIRPTQYYRERGVPVLRSANVRDTGLEMSDLVYMSEADHRRNEKSRVQPGDLVTVRTGYPGTTAVVPETLATANCVDIVITRPRREMVLPEFLCLWVNSDAGRGQVLRAQAGLAQQHFNVSEMRSVRVPAASLEVQAEVVARVASIDSGIRVETATRGKLSAIRTGLAADLLSGRVRTVPA